MIKDLEGKGEVVERILLSEFCRGLGLRYHNVLNYGKRYGEWRGMRIYQDGGKWYIELRGEKGTEWLGRLIGESVVSVEPGKRKRNWAEIAWRMFGGMYMKLSRVERQMGEVLKVLSEEARGRGLGNVVADRVRFDIVVGMMKVAEDYRRYTIRDRVIRARLSSLSSSSSSSSETKGAISIKDLKRKLLGEGETMSEEEKIREKNRLRKRRSKLVTSRFILSFHKEDHSALKELLSRIRRTAGAYSFKPIMPNTPFLLGLCIQYLFLHGFDEAREKSIFGERFTTHLLAPLWQLLQGLPLPILYNKDLDGINID